MQDPHYDDERSAPWALLIAVMLIIIIGLVVWLAFWREPVNRAPSVVVAPPGPPGPAGPQGAPGTAGPQGSAGSSNAQNPSGTNNNQGVPETANVPPNSGSSGETNQNAPPG